VPGNLALGKNMYIHNIYIFRVFETKLHDFENHFLLSMLFPGQMHTAAGTCKSTKYDGLWYLMFDFFVWCVYISSAMP